MVFQYDRLPLDAQILAQKFRAKGKRKLRLQIFAKKIALFVDARRAVFSASKLYFEEFSKIHLNTLFVSSSAAGNLCSGERR